MKNTAKFAFPAALSAMFLFALSARAAPVLSQNNLVLSPGQQTTLSISGGSNTFFISTNTNPSAVTFLLSGMQVTATGASAGSTTATICDQGAITDCVSLSATTQATATAATTTTGTATQGLTFSQNNVNVNSGSGTIIVFVYGGSNYAIASSSNSSAVSASVYGSSINLSAMATVSTSSLITVCSSGTTVCGTLNVGVNGGGSAIFNSTATSTAAATTGSSVTVSQSTVAVAAGQTLSLTVSGGNGSYFVSANPSPNIAGASLNGSSLVVSGVAGGSDTITVCGTGGGCASVAVTVSGASAAPSSGAVVFSPASPSLAVGQTLLVTLSGGAAPYFLSSSAGAVVQASVSGNTLTLSGQTPGPGTLTVCASSGGCSTLSVTVNAAAAAPTPTASSPATMSAPAASTPAPSASPLPARGGATTSLNTASLLSLLTQIHELTALLSQLATQAIAQIQQAGGSTGGASANVGASYKFTAYLAPGSTGAEVAALQRRLAAEGLYSGAVNGVYGASTEAAVKAYQASRGISALGTVGPATRSALNGY